MARLVPSLRLRTVVLAALFGFTTFFVSTVPATPADPRPEALTPAPAAALACADGPSFEGRITSSSSSTTAITASTTGNVAGYISNVVDDWSCTAWYRYDGLVWARDDGELDGNWDWGNLINSTSVACNWALGSTDYLKANSTTDCPDSDAEYAMPIFLADTSTAGDLLETTFHNDITPDEPGDFGFIHSDCESYYGAEPIAWNQPFTTSDVGTRPGSNCDPYVHESTNTAQSIVVDGTAPALAFDWPTAGGPALAPEANVAVRFDATDAVAGFTSGANDWDLKRQSTTLGSNPTTCGTTWTDETTVSGTTSALDQTSQQQLTADRCYRWILSATDANGNAASAVTSGTIRVDGGATLGQPSWGTFESWDLGGGDTLAVNTGTGNAVLTHPVVELPIRGGTLPITLTYNRHDTTSVGLGAGWRLDLSRRLVVNPDGSVTFTDGQGGRHVFTNPTGTGTVTYTRPATLYATLSRDTAATPDRWTLTYRDRSQDLFDELMTGTGVLKLVKDRFGNAVTLSYVGNNTTRINSVSDPNGRTIAFSWDASNRLTQIVDWANVSGGIVQPSGAGNRPHRFFYDTSNRLIGWAGPLNTTSTCTAGSSSAASHLTCLIYGTSSLDITKTQTVTTLAGGSLGTVTRTGASALKTMVTFAGSDVTGVKDGEEVATSSSGTLFSHQNPWQTTVTRQGTTGYSVPTVTRYSLVGSGDPYGRVGSLLRRATVSPETWITTTTAFSGTYPIEVATVTEHDGGSLARTTTTTYLANTMGLVDTVKEPLVGTDQRWTTYVYNDNNDVSQETVSLTGGSTRTVTRTCYTTKSMTCSTSETGLAPVRVIRNWINAGAVDEDTNAFVDYDYDSSGQRIRETRHVRSTSGAVVDDRVTEWQYGTSGGATGQVIRETVNVTAATTYDADPDPTTNARTNLATRYAYDSAGNRTSVADPRCQIRQGASCLTNDHFVTTLTFDALDRQVEEETPTTPGVSVTQKTATTTYDELGLVRSTTDHGDRVTATLYDRGGRATATYEDIDGTGVAAAVQTSATTVDPQGRVLTSRDERQVAAYAIYGETRTEYDPLGRAITVTEAYTAGGLADESTTITTYDALDRVTCVQVGWLSGACATASGAGQSTVTTYDAGDRALSVDDEFTCTTTTYDYRDLATQIVEGRAPGSPCTGTGERTIVQAFDGLGRLTSRSVSGGYVLEGLTLDSLGRPTKTWSTEAGNVSRAVETTYNPLDEITREWRYTDTSGTKSGQTWARSNRDAAGNETDRCTWTSDPGTQWCVRADLSGSISPVPVTAASSEYDARNNRITQYTPGLGTTTYDPDAAYQIDTVYLPTAAGKERQTVFAYDGRHRLSGITEIVCTTNQRPVCTGGNVVSTRQVSTYGYDGTDNRILVTDDNGGGATTRHYCHDARGQLLTVRSSSGCSTGVLETYAHDPAGNRTAAAGRTYSYDADGQLASCSGSPACSPVHDADGRLTRITTAAHGTWSYLYDAEGRLVSACQSTACTGSGFARLDLTYDGEGHRTRLVETTSGGTVTTTTFTYHGDAVVREVTTGATTITRTFVTDEAGAIVKVTISGDPVTLHNGTYLVTWNGHGDAQALSKVDPVTGTLTPANRYTYTTWGTPTTTTLNGYADLGFRYLYVGQYGVTWEGSAAIPAGLHYMRTRHYSPEFGRFLQPDPSRLEANHYGYAGNGPVSRLDPDGRCFWCPALERAVEIIRKAAPFAQKLPSALSALGNRYGTLRYVEAAGRQVRVLGKGAHNFNKFSSGRLKGYLDWVSELGSSERGARDLFRHLTGRTPSGSFERWRSYRGYVEVVYRSDSKSKGPVVEIINHVTRTREKIHFPVGGGR